jgi:hypothetical protein
MMIVSRTVVDTHPERGLREFPQKKDAAMNVVATLLQDREHRFPHSVKPCCLL